MNNKKLVIGIITVFFIGVTGFIYSLGAVNDSGEDVTLTKDAKERESNTNFSQKDNNQATEELKTSDEEANSKETNITKEIYGTEVSGATKQTNLTEEPPNNKATATEGAEDNSFIYVHVCGEVKVPDVYVLEMGTRVVEAIKKAGGFTKAAAKNYINQARIVMDGEKIYIPSLEEVQDMEFVDEIQGEPSSNQVISSNQDSSKDISSKKSSNLVNINTASHDELMTLTGIGEAKANSIIAYREEIGTFKTIEELKNIEGIKDGVYQKIRGLITIN